MPDLRLEVPVFTSASAWRWVLAEGTDILAEHEVRLDEGDWQYEAVRDLNGYIGWHAPPDERHAADETRIVHQAGAWLGQHVLGPDITKALLRRRPATVRLIIPPGAEALAFLPLEIAHAGGRPLTQHDITLVLRTGTANHGAADPRAGPAGQRDRLRVLGLFSLPEGGTPLNLRRERRELVRLINGIAAHGRAAEIRVLQYGVTRDRLRDTLEEAEGWDIVHVSGHGAPGELLLETTAGRPDRIGANDLGNLLDLAREHVRLVTLSACWSAALGAAEQRRLLHLPVREDPARSTPSVGPPAAGPPASAPGTLATELADRLGCAVLAMRYPVDEEFAIGLYGKLYKLLAAKGQPLPRAVALALRHLAEHTGGRRFPALSMAAPALFGESATELCLPAPERRDPVSYATGNLKLAGFPPQPGRFVGRTAVMARASAALAAESGVPGVLLHGMPGGGKTACAVELAYTHEETFQRLVWYKAPDEDAEISGALTDFALTLERYLEGFQMIHVLADDRKLADFLPRLTELMERSRLLIVIDNAESLLTDTGQWRDDRWGQVARALTAHNGFGRLIMTTRRVPAIASGVSAETSDALARESVDALSDDEALLLARELPHLDALIRGDLDGLDRDTSRMLAIGVLTTAQGHPKLLELADGQAADPGRLAELLAAGDQAWREQSGLPDGFFGTGETTASPGDYLHVLAAWTTTVTDTLSPTEHDLFWFLCCLEEPDRLQFVVEPIWPHVREELGRDGHAPEPGPLLAAIAARGLMAIREETGDEDESYMLHPGVAAAGRDRAGQDFQDAVDAEAAAFWDAVHERAAGETGGGGVHTGWAVRAGLAAVPYLLRQQEWDHAAILLEAAFVRDPTRANAAAMLPAAGQITRHHPRHADLEARILRVLDPAAAEARMRAYLDDAAARGDHRAASATAARLAELCRDSGRLAEALTLTEQQADHTRQAGLGPWTRLSDEVWRLQVLNEMGHAARVLDDTRRLRERMDTLPPEPGPDETADPWDVRETLLGTGHDAACRLGRWQDALDLSAEITASERARHAPAADAARTRFNDYGPLLELGRTDDALNLLLDCRQPFQEAGDIEMLGKTLTALAHTEALRGHGDAALRLQRDALRYTYLAADATDIAVSYHNHGTYLHRHARQPAPALASHLTAALIRALTGTEGTGDSVRNAAVDLREFGPAADPPATLADLYRNLDDIPGTDPAALIARLAPAPETAEQTLQDLVAQAQAVARRDGE